MEGIHSRYLFLDPGVGGGTCKAASLSRLSFSSLASCSLCISIPFALSGLKTYQETEIQISQPTLTYTVTVNDAIHLHCTLQVIKPMDFLT